MRRSLVAFSEAALPDFKRSLPDFSISVLHRRISARCAVLISGYRPQRRKLQFCVGTSERKVRRKLRVLDSQSLDARRVWHEDAETRRL